jgi:uncharacterized protein YndB with AHSA1/START domain
MTQATDVQIIRASVDVDAPPARVYRALTGELDRWLADSAAVDLAAGAFDFWGRHVFEAPDSNAGRHALLGHEVGRMLRFSWHVRGAETETTIELVPAAGGTHVDVTQTGVPERSPGTPSIDDVWKVALENLRRWCERGEPPVLVDYSRNPVGEARTQIDIAAPIEAVFDTLTKPELVREWCGGDAEIDLVVGGRYSFGWRSGGGPVEIVDLAARHRLAYTWAYPGEPESVVYWELEGSGGRTRLTITHSGFGDRGVGDYEAGWTGFLVTIRNQVEARA